MVTKVVFCNWNNHFLEPPATHFKVNFKLSDHSCSQYKSLTKPLRYIWNIWKKVMYLKKRSWDMLSVLKGFETRHLQKWASLPITIITKNKEGLQRSASQLFPGCRFLKPDSFWVAILTLTSQRIRENWHPLREKPNDSWKGQAAQGLAGTAQGSPGPGLLEGSREARKDTQLGSAGP